MHMNCAALDFNGLAILDEDSATRRQGLAPSFPLQQGSGPYASQRSQLLKRNWDSDYATDQIKGTLVEIDPLPCPWSSFSFSPSRCP